MTSASIPGAVVGIWGPAGNYVRAVGVADKATHAPMTSDVYSRIGSQTKTFTVTAVLQLVDQGSVKLDDPISKYIQGVPSGDQITLRELARMQSGLVPYDDTDAFATAFLGDPHRSFTPQQLLAYAFAKPMAFPPGTAYEYSNTNIVLLGLVVEKVSGQSLRDYLQQHILTPLRLTHTSFPTTAAFPDPHAQGYTAAGAAPGGEQIATDWNPSWAWAAGAMISTLGDLHIWARAVATGMLLKPETQRQRLETVSMGPNGSPGPNNYGLGIFNASGWIGHSGSLPGYQSLALYLPQTQTTLVMLLNTDIFHQGCDPTTLLATRITSIISPDHVYVPVKSPATAGGPNAPPHC
jgi:D-alanyl-D-alanine carboxypeptidase